MAAGITYNGDDQPNTKDGTGGDDRLYGNEGDDTLRGLGGNDYIDGGVGNDNLDGGDGDDTIWDVGSIPFGFSGIIGHDIIHGGLGNDYINFRSADGGDQADGGGGEDTINISFYGTTFATADAITFTLTPQGNGSTMYIGAAYAVVVQNVEHLIFTGNIGNDVIQGADMSDTLAGAAGDDHLSGLGGNDDLDGGTGKQYLDGGKGIDTASFDLTEATTAIQLDLLTKTFDLGGYGTLTSIEKFDLVYTGSAGDTIVNGDNGGEFHTNGGDDSFTGGKGDEIWNMGSGADSGNLGDGSDQARVEGFLYDTGKKIVHGGNGNDYLFGAAGNDELYGDNNNDFINAQNGNDRLEGGTGNDTLMGGGGNDTINGGNGDDSLNADHDNQTDTDLAGDDVLNGGDGNDGLDAGIGADKLYGGAGNDWASFYWENTVDLAKDTFDGGFGQDTFSVGWYNDDNATYDIKVTGASIVAKANGTVVASAVNVENLYVQGNASGTYNVTGDDHADVIRLGSLAEGNDTINTFGGDDRIESSFGSDTIDSGTGNDTVSALLGGRDRVKTGDGNDILQIMTAYWKAPVVGQIGTFDMGTGNADRVEIYSWNNHLNIVGGKDITLDGQVIAHISNWESMRFVTAYDSTRFVGSAKNEGVEMQSNVDTAFGGGGDDSIQGGGGKDILDGGTGTDTAVYSNYFSEAVSVTLNGARQITVKVNGIAEDRIKNFENVTGGYGIDTLTGDKGNNTLDGWGGNDILNGGTGSDRLIGNAGSDTMTGGTGKDIFAFNFIGTGTIYEHDVITDFRHGEDRIDVSAIDTRPLTARNDAFTLLAHEGAAFDGKGPEVRFDKKGGITVVELDVNGDKFADWHIELTGAVNMTKADFIL